MTARIVEVREITRPATSSIRNARTDFSKITASVVAVVTGAFADARRVVGCDVSPNHPAGRCGTMPDRREFVFAASRDYCSGTGLSAKTGAG